MTDSDLQKFSNFVRDLVGLDFVPKNWPSLRRTLSRASLSRGFATTTEFVKWLEDVQDQNKKIDILASLLTIGETFFFRDYKTFEGIERVIIPDLMKSSRSDSSPFRIWSAGCSTGEEPYSLAILFKRLLSNYRGLQFRILGTDVNKESLEKSIQGFYKEWSFRGAPQWLKKDFFAKTGGGYQLDPSVISLVEFRYLNMASQDYSLGLQDFTPVDIILCRNTMMYFTSDLRNRIIDRMLSWLSEDGWLILSPSEVPHVTNHKLKLVMAPGAVFFRRKRKVSEKPLSTSVEIVEDIKQDRWIIEKPEPSTALVPQTSTRKDLTVPSRAESHSHSLKNDLELARKALAISDYRKTIELLKKRPDVEADPTLLGDRQFTLAMACANLGLLNEAQESIEAALKLDKLNPAYHHMFASILQARNMKQEAVERLHRVLFLDPDHVMANVTLGTIQSGPNNQAESLRYLRNAMTLLDQLAPGEIVPDSDGATAVHIKEMVKSAILNMA